MAESLSRENFMSEGVFRSIAEPIREGLSWTETWLEADRGLIKAWETGRELREDDPDLAARAERGELPPLDWSGGIATTLKAPKFGTLFYLAQWLGLAGRDLNVDPASETTLVCARTGSRVVFTHDLRKYGGSS